MEIYPCNYLKVGSNVLRVYSVVYHVSLATVLLAIIIFAAFILLHHLFYCNLQILFNVTIVIYICTSHILYF